MTKQSPTLCVIPAYLRQAGEDGDPESTTSLQPASCAEHTQRPAQHAAQKSGKNSGVRSPPYRRMEDRVQSRLRQFRRRAKISCGGNYEKIQVYILF